METRSKFKLVMVKLTKVADQVCGALDHLMHDEEYTFFLGEWEVSCGGFICTLSVKTSLRNFLFFFWHFYKEGATVW